MQTVHFGASTVEFTLAAATSVANGISSFTLTPSNTVTAESVRAVVKDASSYQITTDGTVASEVDNVEKSSNVALDDIGNIVFTMQRKTTDEIAKEQMQAQIDALGAQVAALTLGGAES